MCVIGIVFLGMAITCSWFIFKSLTASHSTPLGVEIIVGTVYGAAIGVPMIGIVWGVQMAVSAIKELCLTPKTAQRMSAGVWSCRVNHVLHATTASMSSLISRDMHKEHDATNQTSLKHVNQSVYATKPRATESLSAHLTTSNTTDIKVTMDTSLTY